MSVKNLIVIPQNEQIIGHRTVSERFLCNEKDQPNKDSIFGPIPTHKKQELGRKNPRKNPSKFFYVDFYELFFLFHNSCFYELNLRVLNVKNILGDKPVVTKDSVSTEWTNGPVE